MKKPPQLLPGDRVAAISLSWGGPGTFPQRYEAGKRQLEAALGVTVVETPHALRAEDWLWRNPQARADDLMAAFADPTIKAIFSTIGGDDSMRLLPYLDLDVIRAHPKIFMGYSDTTVTHLACYQAGLVSFYGPAIMAGFGENGGLFPYMIDSVRRSICSTQPIGEIRPNQEGWTVEFLDWADPTLQEQKRSLTPATGWRWLQGTGVRRGRLVGGCFEVLDWLRGTALWPGDEAWQEAILFLESSIQAVSPSWVAQGLRSLAALGVLAKLAGLLIGRPRGMVAPATFGDYDGAIRRVVVEEEGLSELPIITQMDFGHTDPMFVLPYGLLAEIDCVQRRFSIVENAVSD